MADVVAVGPTGRLPIHRGHILGIAAFLILPLAFYTPKGIAPLFIGTAILTAIVDAVRRRTWPTIGGDFAVALCAFTIWTAVSALWSVAPARSVEGAAGVGAMTLAGLVLVGIARRLDPLERAFAERAVIAGGIFAFVALGIEFMTDAGIFRAGLALVGLRVVTPVPILVDEVFKYGNLFAIASLYVWVWLTVLVRRGLHILVFVFALVVLGLFFRADVEVPLIALGGGTLIFLVALAIPRLLGKTLLPILLLGMLAAPTLVSLLPPIDQFVRAHPYLSPSAYSRVDIWLAATGYIQEKPILGYGMDSSRRLPGAQDKILRRYPTVEGRLDWQTALERIPLHPHNLFLQLWVELGVVGVILGFVVLAALLRAIAAVPSRMDRALSYGIFATGLAVGLASFGAWQSWWLAALWLTGALAAANFDVRTDKHPEIAR